jgi:multiple sugar transport system permease protein
MRRQTYVLYVLLLPTVVLLGLTQGVPLAYSAYMSLISWSLAYSPTPGPFVGLGNFAAAFADPVFVHALYVSAIFALVVTAVELALGFTLAYLTRHGTTAQRVVRIVLTVPMAMAPVAVAVMWRLMLAPQVGLVDTFMGALGLPQVDWLGSPHGAIVALAWVNTWQWTAFAMVIYAAGLSAIPIETIQAAHVDGAGAWATASRVVLPLLRPVTWTIVVFRLIDAFFVFGSPYALTGGGPGFATTTIALDIFNQGLRYFNISQAMAESWIVLVAAVVVSIFVLRRRRREMEAGG